MKKMGYLVIAIAVLMLAFGSLGLAYATPNANAQRNQAQNGSCPLGAKGAQGQNCPIGGNGAGKQVGRGGNCGTGECGLGQQAAPAQAGCPGGACAQ